MAIKIIKKYNTKFAFLLICICFVSMQNAQAQQDSSVVITQLQQQDVELQLQQAKKRYYEDSILFEKQITDLKTQLNEISKQDTLLQQKVSTQNNTIVGLKKNLRSATKLKDSLLRVNSELITQLNEQNDKLIKKVKILQEKELNQSKQESVYKDSIGSNKMKLIRLEGLLKAQEINVAAKTKEVEYLQREISIRDTEIYNQRNNYLRVRKDREKYLDISDSLRTKLVDAEKIILQKEEELKYTKKRAEEAEAKISESTNKKKKVRVIQGIGMRLYRTPDWSTRPVQVTNSETGATETKYKITNKNSGSVEFDFITGASVMLWDLTPYFHGKDASKDKLAGWKHFDQEFSYDLGIYVGFGGSNLFKNFYFGPSFKFMDFFHFTAGANIAEYETLKDDVSEDDYLPAGFSIDDQMSKQWKVTMFVALSLDLDFLSYIKK